MKQFVTQTASQSHSLSSIHHFAPASCCTHAYCITPSTLSKAKKHMAVMHPLPRVDELSADVDTDPRAAYFRQMTNGMYVRMVRLECCSA